MSMTIHSTGVEHSDAEQPTPTHLPPPHIPGKRPCPPCPPFYIMDPPPGTEQLLNTYILDGAIWKFAIPLILNLGDLSGVLVVEDIDSAGDGLLLIDALGNVPSLQIHANRIASTDDFVMKTLDLGEG